jgi:hypothetical protein
MKLSILFPVLLICFIISIGFISFDGDKNSNDNSVSLSSQKMDVNNVSTWFRNNGSYNRDPVTGNAGFEWPKATNKFARYASGLMIGAKYQSDTLVVYSSYNYEYLPGYTDNNCISQGKDDPLYRIYKLDYGVNNQDRTQWPNALLGNSDQGAPVYFDVQSNSWKPQDYGNQTMFYAYTDSYPESHNFTQPIKVDIKQINYAFTQSGVLQDVVFSHYKIINRCGRTLNDVYISFWTDDDIGSNATSDKVGCDSLLRLGYTYKGISSDPQYPTPPCVGFLLLKGADYFTGHNSDTVKYCEGGNTKIKPRYKDRGMESFIRYANGDPVYGDFNNYRELYRNMSGLGKNGQVIMHPNGYPTKLSFSGDPVNGTGWVDPNGGDRRFMLTTGPVNMSPGDTQVIVMAQIITVGLNNLNSITKFKQYAAQVRNFYNNCFSGFAIGINNLTETAKSFSLRQNYPNPFNPVTNIEFSIPSSQNVILQVYNALGEEAALLVNNRLSGGVYSVDWDASAFPSGVYFYSLRAGDFNETRKMVLIK